MGLGTDIKTSLKNIGDSLPLFFAPLALCVSIALSIGLHASRSSFLTWVLLGSLVLSLLAATLLSLRLYRGKGAYERKAKREAENLFEEAQRLNRLKDEFLMTLSHELRMPLHGILGWTEILCNQQTGAEQRVLAFENLRRSVEAESRVIDELLDISRILTQKIELKIEAIDLDKVAAFALRAVEAAATEKDQQLVFESDSADHGVRGDLRRLEQIVINILLNAIKFTPRGGRVRLQLKTEGEKVHIAIRDSGIGIAPENIQHIFKRFWQADGSLSRRFGGLGLGLALVQELVSLHGGTIRAESPGEGRGATFTLTFLQNSEGKRDEPSLAASPLAALDLRQLRLLAIDDDPATCKLLSCLFADEFREVRTASSSLEAMNLLGHWRPDFILCDIAMPDENGLMFIKKARAFAEASNWNLHAAALSANADEASIKSALEEGFEAFLTKPVDPRQLVRVVKQLCSRDDRVRRPRVALSLRRAE